MRIRGVTLLRLWAFALLIVASNSMFAANWYVRLSGNNSNNGTSWASAKASINEMVNSPNVSNGDIIFIEGGIYSEQVVIGNKSITLLGGQDAGLGASPTTIESPAYASLTPYTFGTALSWNGAGRLSSNTIRPVVFVNATSSSVSVNIKNLTIDGSTANMSEASTQMLVGLAYRFASGTVGGSNADRVTIQNFNANTESTGLNNAFGAMILTRSAVTFSHVKVENYRNAGIAVVGENLSSASSVIANQPNPTIIDCHVEGQQINGISSGDFIQSGILIANGARATVKRSLVWKNRTNEANSTSDRFAYGIYLYDARTVLIGETTTNKANGNLITDNEIGIYVLINSTAVSATGYTIRQNTIAYNGNETPSGKIASYGDETAENTTYGAIRFNHVPVTNQTLSVTNNAWGNSEAHLFFSANATTADYTPSDYSSVNGRVAFWNQDKGDQITFTSPLSALYNETLYVHEDNSPINGAVGASSGTNGIGVNLEFGFFNFNQLNRAIYAAREQAGTGNTPNVHVKSDVVEDETAVVTKSINVFGDAGVDCADQVTVRLANSLNAPTIWAYGSNTGSTNSDAVTRTPNGITFTNINISANDVQQSASATATTGPAILVTGSITGTNTPTNVRFASCAIHSEFDGSPLAISTDQDGVISARYAAQPTTIDARFTRRPENCNILLVDNDVRDNRDVPATLSLVLLDDVVEVANCPDLQNAINTASIISPRTTIRVTGTFTCNLQANTIANVRIETIAPGVLTIPVFNLNNGGGSGGNIPVCGIEINNESSGITTVNRVNVWPPACLNDAMNIVTDGATNLVVAANSNAIVGPLAYTEKYNDGGNTITHPDENNAVYVQKRFDLEVATNTTAGTGARTAAGGAFTGRFVIQDRLRHDGFVLGIADVPVIAGTMYSTNGTTFGSTPAQVEMKHSRLVADLTNYDFHITQPEYGGNIEMAQQFINPNSGSRRMNFTNPVFSTFGGQNAAIWKRVFVNGQDNRGTQTGIIRLEGSGNCPIPGPDESSVLRNLSVAQVDVAGVNDCIQTAIGRLTSCDVSNQDIEGAGTNATTGQGGTVNLPNVNFNQNVEIAKSISINEATASTNGAVTLRRGAIVLGSINGFTNTVNMNQCYSAHAAGDNPNPQDAVTLAINSLNSVVNIAGYGNTNGLGQGSDPRGVWQFSQINVDRNVDFRGFYHSTSATDLNNCANAASTTRPAISSNRDANLETVLGTHDNSSYSFGGGYIFNVNDNTVGFSASGIKFHNVVHGNAGATTIVRLGNNTGDITFNNNIITGTGNHNLMAGMVHSWGTNNISTLKVNGNHLVIDQASFYQILSINDLDDTYGPSNITENVIDVTNGAIGNSMYFENVDNSSPTGLNIASNWVTGSTNAVQLTNTVGANGLDGITIQRNNFRNMFRGIVISNIANADIGSNNITIKENYINGNDRGLELNFAWTNVTVNRLFVNNNNLANNNMGIYAEAITDPNGPTTNMFDFRFNYWGSELGPVRGPNVAQNPLLAPSDSSRVIGHVPFNHTAGSSITQHPGQPYGRWMVYPVAVTATDGISGTCGWQYATMQAAVLRVNGDGDQLLGMYNTISNGRDNASALAYPAVTGARSTTDQLFVVAGSTYNAINFGYPGASSVEASYPVIFDESPEPSVIRGLNRPRIMMGALGTGNIRVAATYPSGFQVKDFIEHIAGSGSNVTMIQFLNPFANVVDYNFFASSFNHTSYTAIQFNSSSTADANNLQQFTNNRINLGQSPGWPGGLSITSAPTSFKGIEIVDRGPFGGNAVDISNNEISVNATASATRSIGIDVNATNNNNYGIISSNIIRHMSAGNADVSSRTSKWGTGIYVTNGNNFSFTKNDIAGGNTGGGKGSDGITIDRGSNFNIGILFSNPDGNAIGTRYASLNTETGFTVNPKRGYGIKLFSSTGAGDFSGVVYNNQIGSDLMGNASAGMYIGGTSGTVNVDVRNGFFQGTNNILTNRSTGIAVQVATDVYPEAPAGVVSITNTEFGSSDLTRNNTIDLAIGTSGDGATRANTGNSIRVNVEGARFMDHAQFVKTTIVDGRPFAGSNIRNIFGNGQWSNLTGSSSTPGQGRSGGNRFSHAAILTGERNLANYSTQMSRTANAQQLNPASTTEPVRIWRDIQDPLSAAVSTDSMNTVEIRENYNTNVTGPNSSIYNEDLVFPDQRVLLLGPILTNGAVITPLTSVALTSTGRENKDVRGQIAFKINNTTQLYGQIPGSSIAGAVNKGDVYVQGATIGNDPRVDFYYTPSGFISGLANSTNYAVDIKAGIDDADDNNLAPGLADTRHRTGVFVRGNGSSFQKQDVPTAVAGTSLINAYPNPANSDVTVSFIVPINGMVRIALYNALGQKVTDLREEYLNAANYTTSFNVSDLPSGTYHVRMSTEGIDAPLTTSVTVIK